MSGRPELRVIVPLEDPPRVHLVADTYEDEQRLLGWLEHPAVACGLVDALFAAVEAVKEPA